MSVSGILSSSFSNNQLQPAGTNYYQQTKSEFQQLGQDLASGNLSAAQSDFAKLQQAFSQTGAVPSSNTTNPLAQAFQQLATDLKSGNLSAAKQDYTTIQNDLANKTSTGHTGFHRGMSGSPDQNNVLQDLNLLASVGTQAGSTSDALQAYAPLLQQLQEFAAGTGTQASTTLTSDPISMMA